MKHPERVSKLALYGAFLVGLNHYGSPKELEARRALISLTRLGWGLIPRSAECSPTVYAQTTPGFTRTGSTICSASTSPEMLTFVEVDMNIDVRRFCAGASPDAGPALRSRPGSSLEHGRQLAAETRTPATFLYPAPITCFLRRNRPGRCCCRSSPPSWTGGRKLPRDYKRTPLREQCSSCVKDKKGGTSRPL